ncbi:23S rRNA (uracil(1939)-C(5))-methyltransferase RlmD [Deltaproteobacteria bacterium]|nr:23S rRNA (uracil(1939)-C(5))-methyltransferase RlmD [Deltaproteobacteria bacterium]
MIIRKADIVELWVDKMAYGGHGVARLDGFVIFVKGAVPGDRVTARIVKKKKDYADANLVEIIDPSSDRVQAPCPYSGLCGGCSFQGLKYERQLEYKKDQVRDSMARIGSLEGVLVHDVIPSERIYGYRNKMEFSFSDRRWLSPEEYANEEKDEGFGLGLHVPGTFYKVIDIDACLLQQDRGNSILREVKRYVRESDVPVYGLRSHRGFWRFLTLRYSMAFDEWLVNMVTSEENREILMPLAEALFKETDKVSSVVNNVNTRKGATAFGEREITLAGKGYIRDMIGPYKFQISANSFFQTNTSGAGKLYEKVLEYAELDGSEIVLDLYCGTGTIPIFLSGRAKEVIGMEIVESAVLDATRNCVSNNALNCRFILGDIREKLSEISFKPDVIIIDPPRAGIHKDILKGVMEKAARRVVYVSCNPATMARDIGRMSEKYEVNEIQPVDMFPHTYHIEAVAKMTIRKGF